MNSTMLFNFLVDKEQKKINVERSFNASLDLVWAAWTEAEILDKWWAPKPWHAETRSLDFIEGGRWLYSMVGPEGERHWSLFNYKQISLKELFSGESYFCDEQETIDHSMPATFWTNRFEKAADSTTVYIEVEFSDISDLEKYLAMGFKEGFTAGMENLDEYLISIG